MRLKSEIWVKAYIRRCAAAGRRKVALFGAGQHTRSIAPVLKGSPVTVAAIIDDNAGMHGLRIEGREVDLERSAQDVKKEYQPQLFLFSSGDVSDAFEVLFRERDRDAGFRVAVDPAGTIKVEWDDG